MDGGPPFVVIGIGNPHRGDDAVGIVVANRLKEVVPDGVEVYENFGEAAGIVELLGKAGAAILIDAVSSGADAGKVFRFDAAKEKIRTDCLRYSTHAFGVAEAIELARVLGQLPPKVIVFGIEGKGFEIGEGLSCEVEASVKDVVERILEEIEGMK